MGKLTMDTEDYYVVFMTECDGECTIERWSADKIREKMKSQELYINDIAILKGQMVKSFANKIDLSRL